MFTKLERKKIVLCLSGIDQEEIQELKKTLIRSLWKGYNTKEEIYSRIV